MTHNDKDTWTLLIREVKTKDAGEYMCQVNSVPMVSQVAHLEVVLPPEISDKHSTKDISVAEGGNARFLCSASGHPTPTITWKRVGGNGRQMRIRLKDSMGHNHHEKTVKGAKLEMVSVTRNDMGTYMCIARNGVPPATSKMFKTHCQL